MNVIWLNQDFPKFLMHIELNSMDSPSAWSPAASCNWTAEKQTRLPSPDREYLDYQVEQVIDASRLGIIWIFELMIVVFCTSSSILPVRSSKMHPRIFFHGTHTIEFTIRVPQAHTNLIKFEIKSAGAKIAISLRISWTIDLATIGRVFYS